MEILERICEEPTYDCYDPLDLVEEYITDLLSKHAKNIHQLKHISLYDLPKKDAELCLSAILTHARLEKDLGDYEIRPLTVH